MKAFFQEARASLSTTPARLSDPVRVLGIDTTTTACSAALWHDGDISAQRHRVMERGQSEALMPMILNVLAEAGVDLLAVDLFAVTIGPGAFTGVRIGLAAARAMALAAARPCLGVTTTDAIAAAVPDEECFDAPLLVAVGSNRSGIYANSFGPGRQPRRGPEVVALEALGEFVGISSDEGGVAVDVLWVAGDASAEVLEVLAKTTIDARLSAAQETPDAANVARLAAARWRRGEVIEPPRPIYLRLPAATVPKDGGRLRP